VKVIEWTPANQANYKKVLDLLSRFVRPHCTQTSRPYIQLRLSFFWVLAAAGARIRQLASDLT
jgi:hypothetical protein